MKVGRLKVGGKCHVIIDSFVLGWYDTLCGIEDKPMIEVDDICVKCGERAYPTNNKAIPMVVTCKKCINKLWKNVK